MAYRWLTLDGPKCADLPALFHFKRWQNCGPCPDSLFADLDFWLCDATTEGEKRASLLAYEVLLSTAPAHLPNHLNREEKNTAEQIRHWIDQHHRESRLNISAAATHFGLHRSSLYRVFIKHYGVSPVRYLNRLRVRHALGLLQQSSLPVADVAARSGIPDIAYFSRRIKEHTGYSPRAYRQKHRAMETGSGSGRQHPVIC
jgi:AraC-like DNA-binding protein